MHTYAAPGSYRIRVVYDTGNESEAFAQIAQARRTLTVSVAGGGRVTGGGIDCPGTCSVTVDQGTVVPLSAAPGSGSSFAGWGGLCSGTGTCTVTMTADAAISASFVAASERPPQPSPTPTPGPAPTVNVDVVVAPAGGTVLVKVKGTNRFVELKAGQEIPLGSEIDTRKGRVTLTSVPKAGAPPETADVLRRPLHRHAGRRHHEPHAVRAARRVPEARPRRRRAKKAKTRRLWGSGKGTFRTPASTARRPCAAPSGSCRTAAPGRSRGSTEGVVECATT